MNSPVTEQLREQIRNALADQFRLQLNLTVWHSLWRLSHDCYHVGSNLRYHLMYDIRRGN